jgi:hypothetical protein
VGKVDDLRKMREARYMMRHGIVAPSKEIQDAAASLAEVGKAVKKGAEKRGRKLPDLTDDNWKPEALCGHKGVGGKSCTRPKDHPEKNHRYK